MARSLIMELLQREEEVLEEPAPEVLIYELSESWITLRVRWWIAPPRRRDALRSRDRVLTEIKRVFTENGIDLPFPTHMLLLHDQTEETDGDRGRQREGWPAGNRDVPKPRGMSSGREPTD